MHSQTRVGTRDVCERNGTRIDCEHECLLYHNGINYPCLMKNISISGALVCAVDFPPATIQVGDTCHLELRKYPALSPGKYTSKVTRLGHSKIALYFLSITF